MRQDINEWSEKIRKGSIVGITIIQQTTNPVKF